MLYVGLVALEDVELVALEDTEMSLSSERRPCHIENVKLVTPADEYQAFLLERGYLSRPQETVIQLSATETWHTESPRW